MTTQDTKPRPRSSGSQYTYTPQDGLLLEVEDLYVEFRKDNRPIDPSPWWATNGT